MKKYKEYKLADGKLGITDLLETWAYTGSWGQGDHSRTNDPEEAKQQPWVSYNFNDVPQTIDSIKKEIERRKFENAKYIQKLKLEGNYGNPYKRGTIAIKSFDIFDKPMKDKKETETYKFMMLALNNGK